MRIVQFLGNAGSWGECTPDTMNEKGLGGRETALIKLSEQWALFGNEVINFVPVDEPHIYPNEFGGKSYYVPSRGAREYLETFGADIVVSWEEPRIFGVKAIRENIGKAYIEMQVAHMSTTPELDEVVDHYAVLSQWAGDFLCDQEPAINSEKVVVFPNGVDLNRYCDPIYGLDDRPRQFYYSSSPDRGLNHLLKMWPMIHQEFPESVLHICYGVEHWAEQQKWSHMLHAEAALDVLDGLQQPGVRYHGKVGQRELAGIQERSHALLYPCDTMSPTETGCITVVEAGASCSPAFITDCDCLGSEFTGYASVSSMPLDYESYIESVVRVLGDSDLYEDYQRDGRDLAENRDWSKIAYQWIEHFNEA